MKGVQIVGASVNLIADPAPRRNGGAKGAFGLRGCLGSYVHVKKGIYVYIYIYICVHMCIHMYIHMFVHVALRDSALSPFVHLELEVRVGCSRDPRFCCSRTSRSSCRSFRSAQCSCRFLSSTLCRLRASDNAGVPYWGF